MCGIKLDIEPACHLTSPSKGLTLTYPRELHIPSALYFPSSLALSYSDLLLVGFPRFLFLSSFSFVYHIQLSDGMLP